mmetsp:Transcript_35648/g.42944  ORF Transcript_35648/g.42944 Transcript_35648/m.42944 type:complete len:264 (+) Transcript_35648:74-865(+)
MQMMRQFDLDCNVLNDVLDVTNAGNDVIVAGVGDVFGKVRDRALVSHNGLGYETKHCNHSQTSVLNLLDLHGLGPHTHWIEREGVNQASLPGLLPALIALGFKVSHDRELDSQKRENRSVKCRASLKPGSLHPDGVWDEHTEDSHHSPTSVQQLCLLVPLEPVRIGTQTERVESIVPWDASVKVGWGAHARQPHLLLSLDGERSATGDSSGTGGNESTSGPIESALACNSLVAAQSDGCLGKDESHFIALFKGSRWTLMVVSR